MSKQEWGNITWLLFHTLAEKVNETNFEKNRDTILSVIIQITNILPCPHCAEDGSSILRTINYPNVKTKDNLKKLLFIFHNKVNLKLNKPLFLEEDLSKYKNTNTVNVINTFIKKFFNRKYNEQLLMHSFQTQLVKHKVITSLNSLILNKIITH